MPTPRAALGFKPACLAAAGAAAASHATSTGADTGPALHKTLQRFAAFGSSLTTDTDFHCLLFWLRLVYATVPCCILGANSCAPLHCALWAHGVALGASGVLLE